MGLLQRDRDHHQRDWDKGDRQHTADWRQQDGQFGDWRQAEGQVLTDQQGRVVTDEAGHPLVVGPDSTARPLATDVTDRPADPAPRTAPTQAVPVPDAGTGTRTRRRRLGKGKDKPFGFSPWQLVALAAGLALIVVGAIALIRAGVDRSLDFPVVNVLNYTHTALLGLCELAAGLTLLLAAMSSYRRPLAIVAGALLVVAGAIILIEPSSIPDELGTEKDFGWPLAIGGGIVLLASLVMPTFGGRRKVDTTDREIDLRTSRV